MTIIIRVKKAEDVEVAARSPTVERLDAFTIRGHAERHCDVMKWLTGTGLNMPEPR